LDTLGFFTRSPQLLDTITKLWEGTSSPQLQQGDFTLPTKFYYPIDVLARINTTDARELIDGWINKTAAAFGMSIEVQNTTILFAETGPSNLSIAEYTTNVSSVNAYDNYNLVAVPYLQQYAAENNGSYPVEDPDVLSAWAQGAAYSQQAYEENEATRASFDEWVNTYLIPFNESTCTEGKSQAYVLACTKYQRRYLAVPDLRHRRGSGGVHVQVR
jgi:hypothetical protein